MNILLGAKGIATRSKKLLGAPGIATRSKDATNILCQRKLQCVSVPWTGLHAKDFRATAAAAVVLNELLQQFECLLPVLMLDGFVCTIKKELALLSAHKASFHALPPTYLHIHNVPMQRNFLKSSSE